MANSTLTKISLVALGHQTVLKARQIVKYKIPNFHTGIQQARTSYKKISSDACDQSKLGRVAILTRSTMQRDSVRIAT